MKSYSISKSALVLAAILSSSFAFAQQDPPPPQDGPPSPVAPGAPRPKKLVRDIRIVRNDGPGADLRIAPPGMWWKDAEMAQKLALSADQQKRMDDVFQQARIQLIDLKANVEKQNVLLEPMLDANPPDTAKTLAQIDRAAQARADLEKANAKMLLGIRAVLTPDQWTKLRADERSHRTKFMLGGPKDYFFKSSGPGGPESMMLQIPAIPSIEIPAMPSIQIPDIQIDGLVETMPPLPSQ